MGLGDMPIEENLDERRPMDLLPPDDVIEWLQERAANCRRLAVLGKPKDVDGWLDDARYFDSAIALIAANKGSNHRNHICEVNRLGTLLDTVTLL